MQIFHILQKKRFINRVFITTSLFLGLSLNNRVCSFPIRTQTYSPINSLTQKSFITNAIEKSGPAVVTIDTQRLVRKNLSGDSGIFFDPYFEKLFGLRLPYDFEPKIEQSQGSGFIFDDGLVITNAHVINQSEKLIVGLSDGRKFQGKVIGQDLLTDLAVIKLQGSGPWPKASLGNSDDIRVGDWAIAVGNPFGLENTVTLGIISNLNRKVSELGIYDKRFDLIQTDAAINPGNSGGPLLNDVGEVIGINTLIRSGPGAGLSFAIPINKAKKIAKELLINGKVTHPMIGISLFSDITQDINQVRIKIKYIMPNSPAARSGMRINDIILKVNETNILSPSDVVEAIDENGINKSAKILIRRNNKLISLSVKPIDIRKLTKN